MKEFSGKEISSWSCRITEFRSSRLVNPQLAAYVARRLGIDLVATNDVHYTYAADVERT